MSAHPIGKLQRVPLREVWKHEAYDFTHWLQQNLDVLNTALGLNLVNAEREQVLAPISTSSSTRTPPTCGTFWSPPAVGWYRKPAAPSTAPAWIRTRAPIRVPA